MTSPPDRRRSFITRMFRPSSGKDKDRSQVRNLAAYVSSEGSITQTAWNNLSIDAELAVRLKTIDMLCAVVVERRLEVSTLEGLYHQTKDLLASADPEVAVQAMQFLITLTHNQAENLGIALRATFFDHIRTLEPSSLTLAWLNALTRQGTNVSSVEEEVGDLVVEWASKVLGDRSDSGDSGGGDSGELSKFALMSFINAILRHNGAYIAENQAAKLVYIICVCACSGGEYVDQCLDLLDSILAYSFLPRSELLIVVSTICKTVNDERHAKQSWHLMRNLFRSHLGYVAMNVLCQLLETADAYPERTVIRGAVFCVSMGLWGSQRVESLRHSPAAVLPSITRALEGTGCALVGLEALRCVNRLVQKYGRDLQQFTWDSVLTLLVCACHIRQKVLARNEEAVYVRQLHDVITAIELLNEANQYSGSPESLYALVESCAAERPEHSILRLLDYRSQSIYPLKSNWLLDLNVLIDRYYKKDLRTNVRAKTVDIVRRVYTNHQRLYDHKIVQVVIIPLFSHLETEKDLTIQDRSLNLLFDVAKAVSTADALAETVSESPDILSQVLAIVERVLNSSVQKIKVKESEGAQRMTEDLDEYLNNLEIIVCGINDVIDERWQAWPAKYVITLLDMLASHLALQYDRGLCDSLGSDVRERIFALLLRLTADPTTGRLGKQLRPEDPFVFTPHIVCAEAGDPSPAPDADRARKSIDAIVPFRWARIAAVLITAVKKERCWPVLKSVLQNSAIMLSCRPIILSAPVDVLEKLLLALIALPNDVHRFAQSDAGETASSSELTELVCPILAQAVSYDELPEDIRPKLCRAIQEGIVSERSVAAVMATATCVIGLTEVMAPLARDLVARLAVLPSSPRMAIPVLELLSEAAGQPSFFRFFQEKQFKFIVDILAPYTSVDQFTTFIVAIAYRLLFRWFLVVPVHSRLAVARYILAQVDALKPPSERSSEANLLQVERKTSMQATSNSSLQTQHIKSLACLREDARATLLAFLRHFLFTNEPAASLVKSDPFAGVAEDAIRTGHWLVGDTILSLRTIAFDVPQDNDISMAADDHLSPLVQDFKSSASANATLNSNVDGDPSVDSPRRRHQSAVQHRVSKTVAAPPTVAMDDSYISSNPQMDTADRQQQRAVRGAPLSNDLSELIPSTTDGYTEVVVRHAFGRSCWLLRCGTSGGLPTDFYADLLRPDSTAPQASRPVSSATDELTRSSVLSGGLIMMTSSPNSAPVDHGDAFVDDAIQMEARRGSFSANTSGGEMRQHRAMTLNVVANRKSDMDLPTPESASNSTLHSAARSPDTVCEQATRAGVPDSAWTFLQLCQGGAVAADQVVRIPAAKVSQFARTVRTLDLIGHLETHTVGVVYAAPGQKTEAEMLANQYGSERYVRFLRHLGDIVPIGGDSSPGGLTEKDGHFTYVYDDPVTQVVFHVATLMPTHDADTACNAKKRYIGNDFVTIVYNDSGQPYRLGTISGKFAHVAVVVEPQDEQTLSVTLLAKDEISRWLAAKRSLLKDSDAAALCRKMAMRAQLSVNVWRTQEAVNDPPYLSMAVERYRKIKQLRERYTAAPVQTKTFLDAL